MVAMGGGPETPLRDGERTRDFLLCVLPWPESSAAKSIAAIKEEFPNLDVHYIHEQHKAKEDRGKVAVPEVFGLLLGVTELQHRATIIATLAWLPASVADVPNLKFIQCFSAGTNHLTQNPLYKDSDIPFTTASGTHGPQIAEWVIMTHLIHSHNYIELYEAQKKKEWAQSKGMSIQDRVGRRVGILGYGSIGRQVARVAKAMGMNIIAYTASPRPTPESRRDDGYIVPGTGDPEGSFPSQWFSGTDKKSLHEFLRQEIDLLVLAVPLTKTTTHLLSTAEFALLHDSNPLGTYVSNISRGAVIDQPALIKALETKQIRSAALDVTDPEPLPAEDRLWDAPNLIITPHVSGSTMVYAERAFLVLRENLRRVRDGGLKKLVNVVDRDRGY